MKAIAAGCLVVALAVLWQLKRQQSTLQPSWHPTYDYIIVGGGTAGCVLASRLSEDPESRVLLLEAGGDHSGVQALSTPIAAGSILGHPQLTWQYLTTPQQYAMKSFAEQRAAWFGGKVLGGTGSIGGTVYIRGSPHDYDSWAAKGCSGWSYKEVLPYFLKSERNTNLNLSSCYHGTTGPLTVSTLPSTIVTEHAKHFLQAAIELGLPEIDFNDGSTAGPFGSGISQATHDGHKRVSTATAYLDVTRHRPNLQVVTGAHVTRILFNGSEAIGVQFMKDNTIHAAYNSKEVLLSAGTVGSPHILLLSGVGPSEQLSKFGIPLVSDLPVGQNLQDHLMYKMNILTNHSVGIAIDDFSSIGAVLQYLVLQSGPLAAKLANFLTFLDTSSKSYVGSQAPDVELEVLPILLPLESMRQQFNFLGDPLLDMGSKRGFTVFTFLLHPRTVGEITLASGNPFDKPLIDPSYLEDPQDIETLLRGIRFVEKLTKTTAMQRLGVKLSEEEGHINRACSEHKLFSDAYWICRIRNDALSAFHQTGTCKMAASNDPTGVVDPQLRVRGVSKLRVVDASVMPDVTSGNTYATVIMIAEKAADMIQGKPAPPPKSCI